MRIILVLQPYKKRFPAQALQSSGRAAEMEWRKLFPFLSEAFILLVLSAVRSTVAEQCDCTDILCLEKMITSNSSECCLWDFPPSGDNPQEVNKLGYAFGFTTMDAPSFCITYPIADSNVDMKNYFIVKVDLQGGPDVCISEPGKTDKSCSRVLHTVSKANTYCTGNAVSGVQSVNFSVDCTECAQKDSDQAKFMFRVYSESFNTTQDQWCDGVDKTVPSQGDIVSEFYFQKDESDEDKSNDHHNGGPAALLAPLTLLVIMFFAVVLVQ